MTNNKFCTSTHESNWLFKDFSWTKTVDKVIKDNPNLPLGAYMGILMKYLRGKVSGIELEYHLRSCIK